MGTTETEIQEFVLNISLFVLISCFCLSAVDPGVVKTNIMREIPSCLSETAFLVLRVLGLLQSPEVGVSSIVDAALSPPVSFVSN